MALVRAAVVGGVCTCLTLLAVTLSNGPASASPAARPDLALYAAHAKAAADVSGSFIVMDGPLAGTTLVGDASGKVSKKGERHGFIRAPDADCPHFHFEGVEGGKGEKKVTVKETSCLRVVPFTYAKDVVQNVSDALKAEEDGKLGDAVKKLDLALGDVKSNPALDATEKKIKKVRGIDKDAMEARKKGDKKLAETLLERAENIKHKLVGELPLEERMYLPPALKPIDAVFNQANTQTVYTWDVTPRPGSVVNYFWFFTQHNDPPCNQFEAQRPQKNQATYNHGDLQGPCNHALEGSNGHQASIGVTLNDGYYICSAGFFGSNTATGPPAPACSPQV
jgi:hypothetical protein